MSFSNAAEAAVLNQVFIGTALSWNGNTNLWLALHTSNPDESGTAVTNEVSYGSYTRVAVSRATGFTVASSNVSNASLVQFPLCTSGSVTVTHISIVDTASGAGNIIVSGALSNSRLVESGTQLQFAPSALVFTLD
jgi:hypothetical protein